MSSETVFKLSANCIRAIEAVFGQGAPATFWHEQFQAFAPHALTCASPKSKLCAFESLSVPFPPAVEWCDLISLSFVSTLTVATAVPAGFIWCLSIVNSLSCDDDDDDYDDDDDDG